MSSSSNNAVIDPLFSHYNFPFSSPFFCHETDLLIPPNPNFLLPNDFPNFTEPISSYDRSLIPTERKKDMRSKINTAKGPRERRIRLSLNVAQRFFDLQDMLGFNKASKTIDWLLKKSDSAVEELKQMNTSSTGYGCDEVNSQVHTCEYGVLSEYHTNQESEHKLSTALAHERRSSKSSFQLLGRELRAKARKRARQRTKEKLMGAPRACDHHNNKMNLDSSFPVLNQIEASYSERMIVNCSIIEQNSCLKVSQEQRTSAIDDLISITNRNSIKPFMIFNNGYQNWETLLDVVAPQGFCYPQTIAPPEIEFPNSKNIDGGQQPY